MASTQLPAENAALHVPVADLEPAWRTLEYFALARVLIASALALIVAAFGAPLGGTIERGAQALAVALIYFVLAAALAIVTLYVRRHFRLQVATQLAVDLLVVTALVAVSGGIRGGMMILYLLPLAGGALLLPATAAFFVCSLAVIALLLDALVRGLAADARESTIFQAGLYGAALFAITALLSLLATRLAAQERLAVRRGRDLENQLEINRLVIGQMEQGVLVLDAEARVRANNRASRKLLAMHPDAQLTGRQLAEFPALRPLARAFVEWMDSERARGSWSDTMLSGPIGAAPAPAELRLRARFARPTAETSDEFVIFLEDVRAFEERAQQLKLAAMGRLTASIAHEIRNPLAAISHAGQMLGEEADAPLQQRLAVIVRENTQRLNRLVEDVLRVARREPPLGDEIDLADFLAPWRDEFERDRSLIPGRVDIAAVSGLRIKFEQSHLRQILFNLVDNALRYASENKNAVQVLAERAVDDGGRVQLWVFDDGPGVTLDARGALFEPFYTTHARGTGLGLFIAREFCLANRCDLAYATRREIDGASREGFVVRFALAGDNTAGTGGFLDTMPAS